MKFIFYLGLAASAMLMLAACGSKPTAQSNIIEPATTVSSLHNIADTSSSAQDSTSQDSTAASKPTAKINEYYTKLTSHKDEFISVVSQRVEEYRIGTQPDNLNHYEVYPKDYPSAKDLPKVLGINDFIVRQGINDDAMLGIYIAVKIDETHEMRMDMNEQQAIDGSIKWGTGNVYFSHKGDAEFDNWVLESRGEKTWGEFVTEMSSYDITYDMLHTFENLGYIRSEIIKLSPDEIKLITKQIAEDYIATRDEYNFELLANAKNWSETAAADEYFILCDGYKTINLNEFKRFVDDYKNKSTTSCTVLYSAMVSAIYDIQYDSGNKKGEITVTVYTNHKENKKETKIFSGIYDRETDYILYSDKDTVVLPKINPVKTFIDGYDKKSLLSPNGLTIDAAKEAARTIGWRFKAYQEFCEPQGGNAASNSAGIVIPDKFTVDMSTDKLNKEFRLIGAVKLDDKLYYDIEVFIDGEFTGDNYYVDALNANVIYAVSMVDGKPIPIYCKNQTYISAGGK